MHPDTLVNFVKQHIDDDTTRLILEHGRYPGIDMKLAANCIESRRKLRWKVPEWYNEERLIFPSRLSAEQCSSSATGRYKSEVAAYIAAVCHEASDSKQPEWSIADLTGGMGIDSWFFSQRAPKVLYNEMQKELYDAARYNFSVLGALNIEVSNMKAEGGERLKSLLSGESGTFDIVYLDPARRGEGGRKVFLMEECQPDILSLKDEIFRYTRNILLKLSPMADITMVCDRLGPTCREVHIIASGGECKELLIWMDRDWNSEPEITATELHSDTPDSHFSFYMSEEKTAANSIVREVQGYLFEPGKSLMKSGAFNTISSRFGIGKLADSTHYYVTDSPEKAMKLKAYGKVFSIMEYSRLDKRSIKEYGTKYPKSDVTARNIPMNTEALTKRLGTASGNGTHIFGLKSELYGNLLIAACRI